MGSVICPKILSDWHGHKVRAHLLHAMGNWAKEGGTAQHRKGGSRILDEKVWFLGSVIFYCVWYIAVGIESVNFFHEKIDSKVENCTYCKVLYRYTLQSN